MLLDILLGLVILLFIPFGIRRGVAKEAMVSAGILLGANLAARFGTVWGEELSRLFSLEPGAATFAASVLILFGCTFLLGYGGGAALGALRPGTLSRLVGGLLAAFNAALLLSYLLTWIGQILQQGAALDGGIVSSSLVQEIDLLLLSGAGVLLALTAVGWAVNAFRSRHQPHEHVGTLPAPIAARQRPVRVAPDADAGKYEPGGDDAPRSGRFGPGLDATSPLAASLVPPAASWNDPGFGSRRTNGHAQSEYGSGAPRLTTDTAGQGDETVWAAWSPSDTSEAPVGPDTSQWPVAPSVGVTADERCAVCRAPVGSRDVFCPECGATL